MGVLDEHNRQHTFGSTLGPPTSVVGVSAQQAIDAHDRLVRSSSASNSHGTSGATARSFYVFALVCAAIAAVAALGAYLVGGIGAVAISLVAIAAAIFGVVFLAAALIESIKGGVASFRGSRKPPNSS